MTDAGADLFGYLGEALNVINLIDLTDHKMDIASLLPQTPDKIVR